jgi:hypothetical protein
MAVSIDTNELEEPGLNFKMRVKIIQVLEIGREMKAEKRPLQMRRKIYVDMTTWNPHEDSI